MQRARADAMATKGATRGTASATRAQKRRADAADEEQRRRAAEKARGALEDVEDRDGPEADVAADASEELEERMSMTSGPCGLEEEELIQG